MIAVLDASAAIELVFKRPSQAPIEAEIEQASAVIAPELHIFEVSSAFWNHPVYDSMYLVLARRNDAILVSIDRRMRDLAGRNKLETLSLR